MAHPVVGSGLETLLRLERRFEVRRVTRLVEAAPVAQAWPADIALVDGVLIREGGPAAIGVPALVLSGSPADAQGLGRRLDDARGWLRKDPTPAELAAAIDRVIGASGAAATRLPRSVLATAAGLGVTAALIWVWLALRSAV